MWQLTSWPINLWTKLLTKAKNTNVACATLFDRLVAKSENKKLALIAVCNKLLKQAFAIVESGMPYHADFSLRLTPTP